MSPRALRNAREQFGDGAFRLAVQHGRARRFTAFSRAEKRDDSRERIGRDGLFAAGTISTAVAALDLDVAHRVGSSRARAPRLYDANGLRSSASCDIGRK